MNAAKKVFNVFGILLAWVLSIALIVMLLVAPMVLSALSLLNPQTITQAVTAILGSAAAAPAPQQSYGMVSLSSAASTQESPAIGDILGGIDAGMIEDLIGQEVDPAIVEKILASNAAKEFIETYTEDITNAFTGDSGEMQMDADKIIEIIENNMDEIVEIIQEVAPDITEEDIERIKTDIKSAVAENADQIVDALPKPEEFRDELIKSNPELEMALGILAQLDTIKLVIVGAIAAVALLIFLCRLPGLRGFRWLATNLFIAGGLNALICGGLLFGNAVIIGLVGNNAALVSLVNTLLSAFTTGMLVRTGGMLAAAVVLLVVYILIKKAFKKKAAKAAVEAVDAPAVEEIGEAPAAEPVAEETPVSEEVPALEEASAGEETPAEQPEAAPANAE